MKDSKKQKIIAKALRKALAEADVIDLDGKRNGFVVTCLADTEENVTAVSMLIDPGVDHDDGPVKAVASGGHVALALRVLHETSSESIEEIVDKSGMLVKAAGALASLEVLCNGS